MASKVQTHWQWYKGFFGIVILRYLVTWFAIVPIIAKLFSGLDLSIKFGAAQSIKIHSDLSLPFSLQILWLSSFFYVLALLLYQIICPSFIKKYSSFGDYKKHIHSPRWIIHEALDIVNDKIQLPKLFERLSTKKYLIKNTQTFAENKVEVETDQTVLYFTHRSSGYKLGLPIVKNGKVERDETEQAELEIFWEIFGRFSSSKAFWRITIIILLSVSAALFFWTLGEHIVTGFGQIL
jgi:hypothetical protein